MTFRTSSFALAISLGGWVAACGGSTTIDFVGEPGGAGGGATGGGHGLGGADGGTGPGGLGGVGTGGVPLVTSFCGDGNIDAGEICDDGNERSRDGCSSACAVEGTFVCTGEPSECKMIGNGTVDPGEECDDGNEDDGDGCSAEGTIEGTCEAPEPLVLVDGGFGTSVATVTANTAAGGGSSAASACGGLSLGAGNDRVYALELTAPSDFTLTVESDFDAVVRIYGSYSGSGCEPAYEAFCIDDVGADGTETFDFPDLGGGGTIIVVVDGVEEGEAGEFTLTATAGCDVDHLRLHRLNPVEVRDLSTDPNYGVVSLINTADYCTVDLSNAGILLTESYGSGSASLPQRALGPGQVFRLSLDVDDAINPNSFDLDLDVNLGLDWFDAFEMGVFLCDGACSFDDGANVFDGVSMGGAQVPNGVTFAASLPDGEDNPYAAFVRVDSTGVAPDFVATDWSPAFLVDPDDLQVQGFTLTDDPSYPGLVLAPPTVEEDAEEGTALAFPAPADSAAYSSYSAVFPLAVANPTYVSYKVRTGDVASYGCYLGFGATGGALGTNAGFASSTQMSEAFRYYLDDVDRGWYEFTSFQVPGDTTLWHTIELVNIDWTTHTYEYRYDGVTIETGVPMQNSALASVDLFALTPYYEVPCTFSDIIVRNGPDGRVWESPPVLP
jgi:cysteine-rich repeat protein